MIRLLKARLYFFIASYFRFFARIRLKRWNPRIIVITGSSGKTTLLHFTAAQLGKKALYTHHANSSYGIPFHILGLERKTLTIDEWIGLFFKAPFCALKKPPKEQLYIVEADCDRPGEGKFLAEFLQPEVTLWVSLSKTHSMNFDHLVTQGAFAITEEAIAHEFGYFIEAASRKVIINADSDPIINQLPRSHASIEKIYKKEHLTDYTVGRSSTTFIINQITYRLPYLLPETTFYAIALCIALMRYLHEKPDLSFSLFTLPPGRSSLFKGIKNTTIIDSTYNANLSSMETMLQLFHQLPFPKKWIIAGDLLEQGKQEKEEHEKLADLLSKVPCERIVLMGPRVSRFIYPQLMLIKSELKNMLKECTIIEAFETPVAVLNYLKKNIAGGETLFFKGARFLEGVIEHLLEEQNDRSKLVRREKVWEMRRTAWGL